jgi:hypothetical protein
MTAMIFLFHAVVKLRAQAPLATASSLFWFVKLKPDHLAVTLFSSLKEVTSSHSGRVGEPATLA